MLALIPENRLPKDGAITCISFGSPDASGVLRLLFSRTPCILGGEKGGTCRDIFMTTNATVFVF